MRFRLPKLSGRTKHHIDVLKNLPHNLKIRYVERQQQVSRQNETTQERLTMKRAMLVFLELWGLGSRSIFYTIWHLMSRPGYMLSDYINGKRNCYLQPFKTLFVLSLLLVQLAWIFNVEMPVHENITPKFQSIAEEYRKQISEQDLERMITAVKWYDRINDWRDSHRALDIMLGSIWVSMLTYLLWHKSPRVMYEKWFPDNGEPVTGYNFAELMTVIIYILCQLQVFCILYMLVFHSLPFDLIGFYLFPGLVVFIILYIDFKQLFQRGWWATLWRTAIIMMFI